MNPVYNGAYWPAVKRVMLTRLWHDRVDVYIPLVVAGMSLSGIAVLYLGQIPRTYEPIIQTFTQEEVAERTAFTRAQYEIVLPESGPFTEEQMDALVRIAWKESRWNPEMKNPASTSHGLFGFLRGTCRNYGGCSPDALGQTKRAMDYIEDRYSTPQKALAFHDNRNYY